MERYQKIVRNKRFQREYQRLEEKEQDRRFCRHNMEHFLAAARISLYQSFWKTAGDIQRCYLWYRFLHDLGRMAEYETGNLMRSWRGSCRGILRSADMSRWRLNRLQTSIRGHRRKGQKDPDSFADVFYQADKLSRDCIHCRVREECYWPEDRKNDRYRF